jgi:hypothetical protein
MAEQNKIFKVKAGEFSFSIDQEAADAADLMQKSPSEFNILKGHRSVNAKLLEENAFGKKNEN